MNINASLAAASLNFCFVVKLLKGETFFIGFANPSTSTERRQRNNNIIVALSRRDDGIDH